MPAEHPLQARLNDLYLAALDDSTAPAAVVDALLSARDALAAATPEAAAFLRLRVWRANEARSNAIPPYVIATDAVLRAVAAANPHTSADLVAVRGMTTGKVARYGDAILNTLKEA